MESQYTKTYTYKGAEITIRVNLVGDQPISNGYFWIMGYVDKVMVHNQSLLFCDRQRLEHLINICDNVCKNSLLNLETDKQDKDWREVVEKLEFSPDNK